jgi:4a-hydroxytetrahydrobiopterin dehydratase
LLCFRKLQKRNLSLSRCVKSQQYKRWICDWVQVIIFYKNKDITKWTNLSKQERFRIEMKRNWCFVGCVEGKFIHREIILWFCWSIFFYDCCQIIIKEKSDHHPNWKNVYNKAIDLNTHDADGITKKDFQLAKGIDQWKTTQTFNLQCPRDVFS